jgi:Membrane domain of glycerophosphoryl diester phosphodiesterase
MDGERGLDVGELFGALGEQVRANPVITVLAIVCLTIGNLALDQASKSGSFAAAGIMSLVGQYYVTRSALNRSGLLPDGFRGKFGSFWGMNIITGVLILLGCVLLIVPGLFLAARWFVAGPTILAEEKSAGEGMSESWELMKDSTWHVVGALLVLYAVGIGLGVVPDLFFPSDHVPLAAQAVSYLFIFTASVLSWLMSVGAYQLVARRNQTLAEVFA